MKKVENKLKGYMAVSDLDKSKQIQEEFKGEVKDEIEKFPRELGAKHPFEFEDIDNLVKNNGVVAGVITKIKNLIMGEFQIKCKDVRGKKLINDFIKESDFYSAVDQWITEGLAKGNGFMDLSNLKNQKVKTITANQMWVSRDKKGNIKGYNQFLGKSFKNFDLKSNNVIPFNPNEIAHLKINALPGDAYGCGLIMPNERVIENLVLNEQDMQKLITRKAGAPIHVKVGQPGEISDPGAVDSIKNNLVYMTNRTEWVTDANVEMNVLEFGEVGKNLTENLMYNYRMLLAGMNMAEVLMGSGQLNEGIAKVQLEGVQRFIASLQEQIEPIIENQILKPLLELDNRFDELIEREEAQRKVLGIKTKRTKQNWCPTSEDNNTYNRRCYTRS